jgi:flagellin
MGFSVATNLSSLGTQSQLDKTNFGLERAIARLSSGLRINTAADDAAGMAIANRHKLDYSGLQVGIRSANDGISRLQIEDGAMSNITQLLDRALTLAAQAASDTFLGSRAILDAEYQGVLDEIDRTAQAAGLNTGNTNLGARVIFVGNTQIDTSAAVSFITVTLTDAVDATGLAINTTSVTSQANASAAMTALQTAVNDVGLVQGTVGAAMNRLQFAISQAQTLSVNVAASESRIRDANMAEEASNMTKYSILSQSGLAALAQANQAPGAVLRLLQ